MNERYDIVVVGGGLVGSSLVCALAGSGWRVAQVEAVARAGAAAPPSFDERHLALARASVNALAALGVWRHLAEEPAPIRHVHVSSRGDFGAVRLDADRYHLDSFGALVAARELGAALQARVDEVRHLTVLRPARVLGTAIGDDELSLQVDADGTVHSLRTRLLVAADGTHSALRGQLGIDARQHDYRQTLFVATLGIPQGHGGVAYERFTDEGPVALLPLSGNRAGCVCAVRSEDADAVAALDEDGFRELLQARFGWRLGRFGRIGRRSAYPLTRVVAERLTAQRGVVVGNAAQTLHPIGAQGFNLGLRDALTLAEELGAARPDADPGDAGLLARYAARRAADRERTMAFTDGLLGMFAHRGAPVRLLRSMGVVALDRFPGLASGLVAGAMGFRGDVPRLAHGDAA